MLLVFLYFKKLTFLGYGLSKLYELCKLVLSKLYELCKLYQSCKLYELCKLYGLLCKWNELY